MAEITATAIQPNLGGFNGSAKLWHLSEPVPYGWDYETEEPEGTTEFVVTSAVVAMFSGPETYIFPASSTGEVVSWGEMDGSYRGGLDHEQAIEGAGWVVIS